MNDMDVIDLRDAIKELRVNRAQQVRERAQLLEDIEVQEKEANQMKSTLTLAEPDGLLRYNFDDMKIDIVADKKFLEADTKMNIQILNADIRKALPVLESQALSAEASLHHFERAATAASYAVEKIPSHYRQTAEEIEQQISHISEEIHSAELRLQRKSDEQADGKRRLEDKLQGLQAELSDVIERSALAVESRDALRIALEVEESRLEHLEELGRALEAEGKGEEGKRRDPLDR